MLFGKKKKRKAPAPKKETGTLWQMEFVQSETYKGYRKIKLSRYYHEQIDKSMAYFVKSNYDMNGRTVKLTCTRFDKDRKDGCRIDVRVAGKLIGTVWQSDEQQWPMLTEYDFDNVYVRIDDTWPDCPPDSPVVHTTAYLFVHYPADAPIKKLLSNYINEIKKSLKSKINASKTQKKPRITPRLFSCVYL